MRADGSVGGFVENQGFYAELLRERHTGAKSHDRDGRGRSVYHRTGNPPGKIRRCHAKNFIGNRIAGFGVENMIKCLILNVQSLSVVAAG